MNRPSAELLMRNASVNGVENITTAGGNVTHTHIQGGYHHHTVAAGPLASNLYDILRPAAGCSFNFADVPSCHPGTRSKLLEELDDWVKGDKHPICWLTGPVGSGKTSIAQTLAQKCSEQHTLAANFFFNREKRNRIVPLVRSLVYTMCASHEAAIPAVERVLQLDRDILQDSTTRRYQFIRLLLEVLREILDGRRVKFFSGIMRPGARFVIVIDGIDGCVDWEEMRAFVQMLVEISSATGHGLLRDDVRILLTGRIGGNLESTRDSPGFRQAVKEVNVQDSRFDTSKDIRKFLKCRLKDIRRRSSTSSFTHQRTMQMDEQLERLVDLSKGSFHFTKTILGYLDHEDTNDRVNRLLGNSSGGLYNLYAEVLLDRTTRENCPPHFKGVLGTAAYLNYPLSIPALRQLLHPLDPLPSLLHIHSLLSIPDDDKQPVEPICDSLWEYLKAYREKSIGYYSDGLEVHFSLATSCLRVSAQLSQDGEGESSRSERSTTLGWVKTAETQQYASVNWLHHLLESVKISQPGRLEEIERLLHQDNVWEENIYILLKSSFPLWSNILLFKIDDTRAILEFVDQLYINMKDIQCSRNLSNRLSRLFQKLKEEVEVC